MKLYIKIESSNPQAALAQNDPLTFLNFVLQFGSIIHVDWKTVKADTRNGVLSACYEDLSFIQAIQDGNETREIPTNLKLAQLLNARPCKRAVPETFVPSETASIQHIMFEQDGCGVCLLDAKKKIGEPLSLEW